MIFKTKKQVTITLLKILVTNGWKSILLVFALSVNISNAAEIFGEHYRYDVGVSVQREGLKVSLLVENNEGRDLYINDDFAWLSGSRSSFILIDEEKQEAFKLDSIKLIPERRGIMLLSANSTVKDEFLLEDYFGSLSNKFGRFVLQWRVDLFVGDESGNYYTRKYYGSLDFFLPEGVKHIGSRGLSEKTYVWKYSEIVFSKGED